MKTIRFSENELEFMRQLYLDELANAEEYILQIKEILKKLGVPVQPASEEASSAQTAKTIKQRGRKKQPEPAEPKEPKKRGRKPKNAVSNMIDSLLVAKQTDLNPVVVDVPKKDKKRGRKSKSVSAVRPVPKTETRTKRAKRKKAEPVLPPVAEEKPDQLKSGKEKSERKSVQKKGKKGKKATTRSKPRIKKAPSFEIKEENQVISDTVVPASE